MPPPPIEHPKSQDPSHPPPPPEPVPGELVRGVCEGILGGKPPLDVTILSLDRDSYAFGDEFIFVLQVKALQPARVPVRISLAEVELSDSSVSYKWRPMLINMELHNGSNQEAWIRLLQLYGSPTPNAPGSEIELKAGEWVEMRGKARMEWSNPDPGTREPSAGNWFIRVPLRGAQQLSARAMEQRQGSFWYDATTRQENQMCDYPAERSGSGVPIPLTLIPKPPD